MTAPETRTDAAVVVAIGVAIASSLNRFTVRATGAAKHRSPTTPAFAKEASA
jgi:hypothetical protein